MIANLMRLKNEEPYTLPTTPAGYVKEGSVLGAATAYVNKGQGLVVMTSIATKDDGHKVLHVSLSRRSRLPDWNDVKRVKDAFIGEDKEAYHVLPKKADYINIHPYCLHLWHELEEEPKA